MNVLFNPYMSIHCEILNACYLLSQFLKKILTWKNVHMSCCPIKTNYYGGNKIGNVPRTSSFCQNNKSDGTPHIWVNDIDD